MDPVSSQGFAQPTNKCLPENWRVWLAITLAAFFVLLLLIRPVDYSDTFNYAKNIADQLRNHPPANGNPFFDFGHLLWRPLATLFFAPFAGSLSARFGGDEILGAGSVLIALSILASIVGTTLLFLWIARATGSAPAAAFAAIAYSSTNAILHYSETGMAYLGGIACLIASFMLVHYFLSRCRFTLLSGLICGVFLGLSIVIWFPYVLAAAGVACYALLAEVPAGGAFQKRVAGVAGIAAGAAIVVALVYGPVIVMAHYTSVDAILQWISGSRYGKSPDRGLLRMVGGIPRGFFDLGEGSVAWKRMLFEGRGFAPGALIRTGIWKVALVYAVVAVSVVMMARSSWGRRLLICFVAVAIPLIIFAAFLFEADPPERYMAAYPLLFLAFGCIMANRRSGWLPRGLLAVLFVSMLAVNLTALSRFRTDADLLSARPRLQALNQVVQPEDQVLILSYKDNLFRLVSSEPFNPESKNRYLFVIGLPWGQSRSSRWAAYFAQVTRDTWAKGGQVWLSRRFLAAAPDPTWGWVEGDLRGVSWPDLPAFFSQVDLEDTVGGSNDGFSRIAHTDHNAALLKSPLAGQ